MSLAFEVREWNGPADDGSDEYGERRVVEAYDHRDAALRFMEKMDAIDLPQLEARLLVRPRGTTDDVRVDVEISVRRQARIQPRGDRHVQVLPARLLREGDQVTPPAWAPKVGELWSSATNWPRDVRVLRVDWLAAENHWSVFFCRAGGSGPVKTYEMALGVFLRSYSLTPVLGVHTVNELTSEQHDHARWVARLIVERRIDNVSDHSVLLLARALLESAMPQTTPSSTAAPTTETAHHGSQSRSEIPPGSER